MLGAVVGAGSDSMRDRDSAVSNLYREHGSALVRLAVLLVDDRGAAEEVVHDAFVQLMRAWPRLRDPGAALGYLRVSVVNGCRSRLRRRGVRRRHRWPDAGTVESAETAALARSADERLVGALAKLPPRQRECLVLRYFSDLSEAEVAATLGIAAGSVKSHTHRGLQALAWIANNEEAQP